MQKSEFTEPNVSATGAVAASPAAETVVTTRQLVEALALLDSREQEATAGDTIKIGDAIRELGLDSSPEEVLAAVREIDQRAAVEPAKSQGRLTGALSAGRRLRGRTVVVVAAAVVVAGCLVGKIAFDQLAPTYAPLTYSQFLQEMRAGDVRDAVVSETDVHGMLSSGVGYSAPLPDSSAIARNNLCKNLVSARVPFTLESSP